MVAVRGIAERTEVRVMGRFDAHAAARTYQAVEFLHGGDHIVKMFDHMNCDHAIEAVIGEWIGVVIEVANDVSTACGVVIDADSARLLANAAADVQNPQLSRRVIFRHSSSTSTANSA